VIDFFYVQYARFLEFVSADWRKSGIFHIKAITDSKGGGNHMRGAIRCVIQETKQAVRASRVDRVRWVLLHVFLVGFAVCLILRFAGVI